MAIVDQARRFRMYLGVDIGGTKIQALVAEESGAIVRRERLSTPRDVGPEQVVAAVERLIEGVLCQAELTASGLAAMGIAVPGVVDPQAGRVVVTPNMTLTGVALGSHLEARFHVPVALGNDCNLGILGESWLGSARKASSAMGIFVGTGIGGGFVRKGKLWRGAREAAGEIGHIVMQIGGPKCGCGNHGCFEALASRTAIENQLREGVHAGRKTVLTELMEGNLQVIRSSVLRQALQKEDPLVSEVMRNTSEILGYACLTVRHLVDPEVIVLGGGVVEACSDFVMPIVENIVGSDQLPGARPGGRVLASALGDDAVSLGAVALARMAIGRSPFKRRFAVAPSYAAISRPCFGEITVGSKTYTHDIYIKVDGSVEKRKKKLARESTGTAHTIGPKELERVCEGGPEVLFVGTGESGVVQLDEEAHRYLAQRSIECQAVPTPTVSESYNRSKKRKAALIHVTC